VIASELSGIQNKGLNVYEVASVYVGRGSAGGGADDKRGRSKRLALPSSYLRFSVPSKSNSSQSNRNICPPPS